MSKVATRPEIFSHHHQETAPITLSLPHDTNVEMTDDLHICYSIVSLARQALAYDDGSKDSPSFSASVALDLVASKLMKTIDSLDNLNLRQI